MSRRPSLRSLPRLWFGLAEPVGRGVYASTGIGLMLLKYLTDVAVVYLAKGIVWTPLDYVNPLVGLRIERLGHPTPGLLLWMGLWTLPFLWIGISMSVRRAADAGLSPWQGFWFLVPVANYVAMIALSVLPSRATPSAPLVGAPNRPRLVAAAGMRVVLLAVLVPVVVALGVLGSSVFLFGRYGSTLFLGTPLVMGALSGFILNREHPRRLGATLGVALTAVLAAGGALLLFALEGVLCLAMTLPLAVPLAALGACVGRAIAMQAPTTWAHAVVVVLLLPALAGAERSRPALREVMTAVEIAAPPDTVWERVIGFGELPPPSEWLFRHGIAYPERAHIDGSGVGAVRRCEFSTGAFVEPITAWDAPHRLAFDVSAQPPPMREWSPWSTVRAPHLRDYLRSRRGEFRLVPSPSGGTRLEGRTWYEVEIFPQAYWWPWADTLIHQIHARVLQHVKRLAEIDASLPRRP